MQFISSSVRFYKKKSRIRRPFSASHLSLQRNHHATTKNTLSNGGWLLPEPFIKHVIILQMGCRFKYVWAQKLIFWWIESLEIWRVYWIWCFKMIRQFKKHLFHFAGAENGRCFVRNKNIFRPLITISCSSFHEEIIRWSRNVFTTITFVYRYC